MTVRRTLLRSSFLALPLWAACATDSPPPVPEETTQLEIFSWWTAPGEAEALDALLGAHHTRHPDVTISNIVVRNVGADPELQLQRRLFGDATTAPAPPDLMQWNMENMKAKWVDTGARFTSFDSLFEAEGWMDKFRPEVLEHCTVDGHIILLPIGLHRINSMMFGKQLLADIGIGAVPASWSELVDACEQITAAGKTCISLTQEGWVQNIFLTNVAVMTMGTDAYHSFFSGTGNRNDPGLVEVVENYERVLDNYVGGRTGIRATGWEEAAKDVFRGETAFFMHGDWSVALLRTLGWNEQDFGVVSAPGARSLFVYTADGFMIPADGAHQEKSLDVARTFGAPDTLAKFAAAKGASPPRIDVDVSSDPLTAGVYTDLQQAERVMRMPGNRVSDADFARFLTRQIDKATFVELIRQSIYPL